MLPIVYRVLVPGMLVTVLCGISAFFEYQSYIKSKKKSKKKRSEAIIYLIICLCGLSLAVYNSFDLVCKDYVTQQGTYLYYHRDREVYIEKLYFSVDGSDEYCYEFSWNTKQLEEGKQYKFTYAKRTMMLISIDEIETKTQEDDTSVLSKS